MKTDIVQKAIVFCDDATILLLRRSESDIRRPLQWDLPGGSLEEGELLESGVLREITEETGIELSNPRLLFSKTELSMWIENNSEKNASTIRLYYSVRSATKDVIVSNEHSEFAWVTLDTALEMIEYHRHKEVLNYVRDNNLEL